MEPIQYASPIADEKGSREIRMALTLLAVALVLLLIDRVFNLTLHVQRILLDFKVAISLVTQIQLDLARFYYRHNVWVFGILIRLVLVAVALGNLWNRVAGALPILWVTLGLEIACLLLSFISRLSGGTQGFPLASAIHPIRYLMLVLLVAAILLASRRLPRRRAYFVTLMFACGVVLLTAAVTLGIPLITLWGAVSGPNR